MRSVLDLDCLKSLSPEKTFADLGVDGASDTEDIQSPILSLDDSLELIRRTGLDPHLLSLLGLESTDPGPNTDQDSPHSDRDNNASPHFELEVDSQKETAPELETVPEQDTGMQLKPNEDQKEQELEHPSEASRLCLWIFLDLKPCLFVTPPQGMHMSTGCNQFNQSDFPCYF